MHPVDKRFYDVVGIAASAGGFKPIIEIISSLPADFPATVLIAQHTNPRYKSLMPDILSQRISLKVMEAKDGDRLISATVYTAKANKHIEVNSDGTISLGSTERVHFVRPSADVLFMTMAVNYRDRCIAVILSGAGQDGAIGSLVVKTAGGKVMVQQYPEVPDMPKAAVEVDDVDFIISLADLAPLLVNLVTKGKAIETKDVD